MIPNLQSFVLNCQRQDCHFSKKKSNKTQLTALPSVVTRFILALLFNFSFSLQNFFLRVEAAASADAIFAAALLFFLYWSPQRRVHSRLGWWPTFAHISGFFFRARRRSIHVFYKLRRRDVACSRPVKRRRKKDDTFGNAAAARAKLTTANWRVSFRQSEKVRKKGLCEAFFFAFFLSASLMRWNDR